MFVWKALHDLILIILIVCVVVSRNTKWRHISYHTTTERGHYPKLNLDHHHQKDLLPFTKRWFFQRLHNIQTHRKYRKSLIRQLYKGIITLRHAGQNIALSGSFQVFIYGTWKQHFTTEAAPYCPCNILFANHGSNLFLATCPCQPIFNSLVICRCIYNKHIYLWHF